MPNILPTSNIKLETELKLNEIIKLINDNTELSESLGMKITNKLFIGKTSEKGFKIISSKFPTGVFSVLEGNVNEKNNKSEIEINVTIQKAFVVLFCLWLLLPIFGIVNSALKIGLLKTIPLILVLLTMLYLLKNFVIAKLFRKTTESGMENLKQLLNANEME